MYHTPFKKVTYGESEVQREELKLVLCKTYISIYMHVNEEGCRKSEYLPILLFYLGTTGLGWYYSVIAQLSLSFNITRDKRHPHPPVRAITGTHILLHSSGLWKGKQLLSCPVGLP